MAETDPDTRFAIAWFEQNGNAAGPFGDADVLARAKNTSVSGLVEAGVLESRSGKNQNYGHPHTTDVVLQPHESKTIPLDGICLDRHKPETYLALVEIVERLRWERPFCAYMQQQNRERRTANLGIF